MTISADNSSTPFVYEKGVAPVKREYLILNKKPTDTAPSASAEDRAEKPEDSDSTPVPNQQDVSAAASRACSNTTATATSNRNKSNLKAMFASSQTALCAFTARDEPCPRANCSYHHDVKKWEEEEKHLMGEDLVDRLGECTMGSTGKCRYGRLCRLASSHQVTSYTSVSASNDTPAAFDNEGSNMWKIQMLRKGQIKLEKTERVMEEIKKDKENTFGWFRESYAWGERKRPGKEDFKDKLYLAPLTTLGNLPFRRICKEFGADITCGEMSVCTNILKGQPSEWALLRRHPSEDFFGVQLVGGWADSMIQCAELLGKDEKFIDCDFIDINMGCPIDLVFKKGMGSGLMDKMNRVKQIVAGMRSVMPESMPLTIKMRIGIDDGKPLAAKFLPVVQEFGLSAMTIHGRTRQQRYTKEADWSFISSLVERKEESMSDCEFAIIGNGDILSWEDYMERRQQSRVDSIMIARGALMKPWLFTEIKEQRTWDIRSSERLEILKKFAKYGLEHFGSDRAGVEKTRRFLLEWISFLCRYVPVGLLERLPPRMNDRPPAFFGRDDLETLMASPDVKDWITLSEILLGAVPEGFSFIPKHKSNSYSSSAIEDAQG